MTLSLLYRLCGQPIKFDDKHISQISGKKIPLDVDTEEPHDCPARREQQQSQLPNQRQQQEKRYFQCNKGCGQEIYFHQSQRTEGGKWIPLDKETGQPHQCQ